MAWGEGGCLCREAGEEACFSPLAAGDRPSSALALWRQGVYIAHLWSHLRKRLQRVAAGGVPRAAGLWLEVGSGCCWNSVSFLANDDTLHISKSSGQGIAFFSPFLLKSSPGDTIPNGLECHTYDYEKRKAHSFLSPNPLFSSKPADLYCLLPGSMEKAHHNKE